MSPHQHVPHILHNKFFATFFNRTQMSGDVHASHVSQQPSRWTIDEFDFGVYVRVMQYMHNMYSI